MIVLVTGGSSGLGLATVRRLSAAGHHVYAASRNPGRGDLPAGVIPLVLDVASPDSTAAAFDSIMATSGGLDVLVNNAGAGSLVGPIEETIDSDAQHVFDVNLFGPLRLARMSIPVMRSRGGGRIINVTSMNDVLPAPFGGWYSSSKAALASASAVLGAEVRQFNIFVTVVAPGLFRTKMASDLQKRSVDPGSVYRMPLLGMRRQDSSRLEKAGDPDEVARAIEECMSSQLPPARIVVGQDAKSFEKLLQGSTADELSAMLVDYVRELTQAGESAALE
jgi:NAD(P)-dependent dehydrogenase (short-subunit alcohol dehydrogenase family)